MGLHWLHKFRTYQIMLLLCAKNHGLKMTRFGVKRHEKVNIVTPSTHCDCHQL